MPELPEVTNLARQMDQELTGRDIATVDVVQAKCLNMPVQDFRELVEGTRVGSVTARGKWAFVHLAGNATLLLNLGMGGDVLFHAAGVPLPDNRQAAVLFGDETALSLHFWWFGYVHAARTSDLAAHTMTATLGVNPLDDHEFTRDAFEELLARKKRSAVKTVLMDQKNIAGIGNVYIRTSCLPPVSTRSGSPAAFLPANGQRCTTPSARSCSRRWTWAAWRTRGISTVDLGVSRISWWATARASRAPSAGHRSRRSGPEARHRSSAHTASRRGHRPT